MPPRRVRTAECWAVEETASGGTEEATFHIPHQFVDDLVGRKSVIGQRVAQSFTQDGEIRGGADWALVKALEVGQRVLECRLQGLVK